MAKRPRLREAMPGNESLPLGPGRGSEVVTNPCRRDSRTVWSPARARSEPSMVAERTFKAAMKNPGEAAGDSAVAKVLPRARVEADVRPHDQLRAGDSEV